MTAADALFISPRTVATHLTHIYQKLGHTSRDELQATLAEDIMGDGKRMGT